MAASESFSMSGRPRAHPVESEGSPSKYGGLGLGLGLGLTRPKHARLDSIRRVQGLRVNPSPRGDQGELERSPSK